MKKIALSIIIAVLLTSLASSQGIYIKAGGGYALPLGTENFGVKELSTSVYNGTSTVNNNSTKIVTGSYGAGTGFNVSFGYKFNENFIFELGTQYLMSNKIKTSYDNTYKNTDPVNGYTTLDYNNSSTSAKAFFLNPSFIFSAGFGKAAPYGKFGLVLGSPKISGEYFSYYNGDGIDSVSKHWEYSKGMSFGFQAAIGMNWKLSEKLDFFTEVNYVSMTYYPGQYDLTKYVRGNGFSVTDELANMMLIDKQTIFKKSFDPTQVNTNSNNARVEVPQATPFSSVSLQVGIRLSLWKKSE